MFSSYSTAPISEINETPARSSPPWVWFGFVFAVAFLVAEFVVLLMPMQGTAANLLLMFIAVCGFVYWLVCIHRFHKILQELSGNQYPISPAEAVWKHFVPILNIIWIFQWPKEFSEYLNKRGRVRVMSGTLIGLLILVSLLLRFFDGAVGLACLFGVTLYLSAKLRKHMQLVKGIQAPPVPDPGLFQRGPEGSSTLETPNALNTP